MAEKILSDEQSSKDESSRLLQPEDDSTDTENGKQYPEDEAKQGYCYWIRNQNCRCRRLYLVEPVLFTVVLAYGAFTVLNPQYIYYRFVRNVAREHPSLVTGGTRGYGHSICNANTSSLTQQYLVDLETKASLMVLACMLAQLAPPLLLSNSIIAYTQKVGRKFALLLACIAGAIAMGLYLIAEYYNQWIGIYVIANCIFGLSGGFFVLLACSYKYVADITPLKNRAFRYAILSSVGFVGFVVATFGTGLVVQALNYSSILVGMFLCFFISIIYVIILLPESLGEENQISHDQELPTLYYPNIMDSLAVGHMIVNRPRNNMSSRTILRFLAVVAMLDTIFLTTTMETFILYLMGPPHCLNTQGIGSTVSVKVVLNVVGPLLGARIMYRKHPEAIGGIVACVSGGIGLIVIGTSKNGITVLLGTLIQFFSSFNTDIYRQMALKTVDPEEKVLVLRSLSTLRSAGSLLGTTFTLLVFSGLVQYKGGIIFILYGVLYLASAGLYGTIYWFQFLSKEITQPLFNIRPL